LLAISGEVVCSSAVDDDCGEWLVNVAWSGEANQHPRSEIATRRADA
jgi:hypothetical protein